MKPEACRYGRRFYNLSKYTSGDVLNDCNAGRYTGGYWYDWDAFYHLQLCGTTILEQSRSMVKNKTCLIWMNHSLSRITCLFSLYSDAALIKDKCFNLHAIMSLQWKILHENIESYKMFSMFLYRVTACNETYVSYYRSAACEKGCVLERGADQDRQEKVYFLKSHYNRGKL